MFVKIAHGAVLSRKTPQAGDELGMKESPQGKAAGRRWVWGGAAGPTEPSRLAPGGGERCLLPSPSISPGSTAEPGAEQKESNDLVIAAAPRV